jgi:5-methylcytosine-specific restriction endonuclease McrA
MRTHSDSPTKTCTNDGCSNALRAKGLCATHYNQQHHPDRHNKTIEVNCAQCGVAVTRNYRATRWGKNFCSYEHGDAYRWAEQRASRQQLTIYRAQPAWLRLQWPSEIKSTTRTFVSTACDICQEPFLCLYGSRTCSDLCATVRDDDQRRDGKHRRRARQRDAYRAPVSSSKTFERDDYECQLCGEPMGMADKVPHPLAPTIDHIIPLARGGTHEPSNVQSAHFICNSYKGDREHVFEGTARWSLAA